MAFIGWFPGLPLRVNPGLDDGTPLAFMRCVQCYSLHHPAHCITLRRHTPMPLFIPCVSTIQNGIQSLSRGCQERATPGWLMKCCWHSWGCIQCCSFHHPAPLHNATSSHADAASHSMRLFTIPTGLNQSAQGCEERATLGTRPTNSHQPWKGCINRPADELL